MTSSASGAQTRVLVVEADGGSRGNPGVAGYGALVREGVGGPLLAERSAPLGTASNNVAEYSGLIAGLQAIIDLDLLGSGSGSARVLVRMDSKLVVEQMSGRWKIKHEDMRRLALQARDLQRQLEWNGAAVTYEWIPREQNSAADALSNHGMDGERIVRDHLHSPEVEPAQDGAPTSNRPDPAGAGSSRAALDPPTFGEVRAPDVAGDLAQEISAVLSTESTPTLEGRSRIVLVRHGVTEYTMSRRLDGRGGSNPPLNRLGRDQARAAGAAVRDLLARSEPGPVAVITSSLRRAEETGSAVARALGVSAEVDRDWDELGFGDWDGRSVPDLLAQEPDELRRLRQDVDYARPGGESRAEVDLRVRQALARAVARGGIAVIATHRIVIMSVLSTVLGIDHDRAWLIATGPASLTALEVWPDGSVQVAFVNETHHLRHLDK